MSEVRCHGIMLRALESTGVTEVSDAEESLAPMSGVAAPPSLPLLEHPSA